MLRVYFASKLKHAAKWRDLCEENHHFIAHARWLKHNKIATPDSPRYAREFWLQDEQDVRDADVVVVYGEEGEHLRGALVEAGIALALGIPVYVVGDHPDYGTWQYHPGVAKRVSLDVVLAELHDVIPRYAVMKRT
jgi:nucleoside 2-deoxyribosyltransferase